MSDTKIYDVIIIGGGPAGFTASIYASRGGLRTVQISKLTGGQIGLAPIIENYPGIISISGIDFADVLREQTLRWETDLREAETAEHIVLEGNLRRVITDGGEYLGKAVIIATGRKHRRLNVPGHNRLDGRGISYCATCDGAFFKDMDVAVVGGGNTALTDAIYLTGLAKNVHVIHRRDQLRADPVLEKQFLRHSASHIHWDTVVTEFLGEDALEGIRLQNVKTKKTELLKVKGAFIAIGADPMSAIALTCGVKVNEFKEILVNKNQETNVPGVYAAGDVTPGVHQIATAVGEGCTAAICVQEYINRLFREV
ncbi:MAG: NAD(P)/FAD-dependent oxidoreductase [Candidatus Ranarchaeia archaeon]